MPNVKVQASPLTPHTEALFEAGKALLIDSIEVGREFCKFMVGVSTSAIPVYLGLVGLAIGKDNKPSIALGLLLLAAPAVFLVAASIFAIGHFPVRAHFSLDIVEEIDEARSAVVRRRHRCARWGFVLFLAAVVVAVGACAYAYFELSEFDRSNPT